MKSYRWLLCIQVMIALGMLLALAACSPGGTGAPTNTQTASTPTIAPPPTLTPTVTPTATPTATPTPTPPGCNANFPNPPVYYKTLPDATFKATHVFAQVLLPPLTRSYDNDASGGVRGRQMCSAGTTASVLNFMTDHLTRLGWHKTNMSTDGCLSLGASYKQQQCWQNGNYALVMGINSSTDWIILFRDPDFM